MEKKVAVFTWSSQGINYGQVLQAYAMYKSLKKLGVNPKLIRYRKRIEEEIINEDLNNNILNSLYEYFFGFYKAGKDFFIERLKFYLFILKNIKLSHFCYSKEKIEKEIKGYDAVICGSDQIWNPAVFDPIFFLDLGNKNLKRIAYAPSICDDFNHDKKQHIYKRMSKLIKNLDYISVREDVGVKIIKMISGITPKQVLDPTLLLNSSNWNKLASKRLIKEKYMICYVLGEIKQQKDIIFKIAKMKNIQHIFFINTKNTNTYSKTCNSLRPLHGIGPEDFLSLIKYSEIVFTDSFHAAAFSINYNKEFFVFRRYQMSTEGFNFSRINSILKLLNLQDRCIDNSTNIDNIPQIDYNVINHNLNNERKKSLKFLKNAIDNI